MAVHFRALVPVQTDLYLKLNTTNGSYIAFVTSIKGIRALHIQQTNRSYFRPTLQASIWFSERQVHYFAVVKRPP